MEETTPAVVKNMKYIGQIVRDARVIKGWSQEKLSVEAGLGDRRSVVNLEAGRSVTTVTMMSVLDALGLNLLAFPQPPFKVVTT